MPLKESEEEKENLESDDIKTSSKGLLNNAYLSSHSFKS